MMNATLTSELLPPNPLIQLVSNGLPWLTVAPGLFAMRPPFDMEVDIQSSGLPEGNEGIGEVSIDGGTITMTANMDMIFRAARQPPAPPEPEPEPVGPSPPPPPAPALYRCVRNQCHEVSADGVPLSECEASCALRYRCIFGQCGRDVTGVSLAQCQSTCSIADATDEIAVGDANHTVATSRTGRGDGTRRQTGALSEDLPELEIVDAVNSSVTNHHTDFQVKAKPGEELFALSCPLRMKLALGVEPARTEDGLPTTRVLVEFLEGTCEVALLRSSVGEINLGPVFGFQGVINNVVIPSLIAVVNEVAEDGFLFPAVMGFSATNAKLVMLNNVAEFGLDLAYSPAPPPLLGASMRVTGGSSQVDGLYVQTADGCVSLRRPVYKKATSPVRWLYLAGTSSSSFRWYITSSEARVCSVSNTIARSAAGGCNTWPYLSGCTGTWQELVGSTWTTRPALRVVSVDGVGRPDEAR